MSYSQERTVSRWQVVFSEVGRDKMGWFSILRQQPTESILERLVRKSGALMSRDIACEFEDSIVKERGIVYAGIRQVGQFQITRVVIDNPGPFSADHIAAAFVGLE